MSNTTSVEVSNGKGAAASNGAHLREVPALSEIEILQGRVYEAETAKVQLEKTLGKAGEHIAHIEEQLKSLLENPLIFALHHLDSGAFLIDAGTKLKELVKVVDRLDSKGSFALRLAVKPFKSGSGAFVFVPDLKISEPKPDPAQSIFYANGETGVLSRSDPRQKEFTFNRGDRESQAEAYERANPELR
jgi:hypothetical protein